MTSAADFTGAGAAWRGLDRGALVELLAGLIQAESPDPPGDETRVAAVLDAFLRCAGFQVETEEFAPGRFNALARVRGDGQRGALVFSAHMDTLPVGSGAWTHPPFGGVVDGGRVFGRGACDMKSGLTAMVSAALAVQRRPNNVVLHGDLVLAVTSGESSNCLGARRLVETGALLDADAILVSEPSSLDVLTAEKAALWLRAEASGVAGHVSGVGQKSWSSGQHAIHSMMRFLERLDEVVPKGEHPLLGGATVNVGTIAGGTAIALTPDRCVAEIDIRLLPEHDADAVQSHLQQLAGGSIAISRIDFKAAVDTPLDHPFVATCLEEAAAVRGAPVQPGGAGYYSDASVLSPAFDLPMVIIGPGELGGSGSLDESCLIDDVEQAAKIFARIALRHLAGNPL